MLPLIGKCDCDPEGGTLKNAARNAELEMEKEDAVAQVLPNSYSLYEFLKGIKDPATNMEKPIVPLEKKKGRGIYRRKIHYVPAAGPAAVNQRIAKAGTVEGSSKWHSVEDVGFEGIVLVRPMSCRKDQQCWIVFSGGLAEEGVSADACMLCFWRT